MPGAGCEARHGWEQDSLLEAQYCFGELGPHLYFKGVLPTSIRAFYGEEVPNFFFKQLNTAQGSCRNVCCVQQTPSNYNYLMF